MIIIYYIKQSKYQLVKLRDIKYMIFLVNEPFCERIKHIISFLKTKNSDNYIENKEAFLIIQGRLKIFDFIK